MSWFSDLYNTFENNFENIGKYEKNKYGKTVVLAPVGHITKNVDLEVEISQEGKFLRCTELPENQRATVIPATVDAVSRSSGVSAYPLHDQIKYLARDSGQKPEFFESYLSLLSEWSEFADGISILKIIRKYLKEGSLFQDIQKTVEKITEKTFVRIYVEGLDRPWEDKLLFQNWLLFYQTKLQDRAIDYISGKELPIQEKHMKIKGNPKLISANQTELAYTGRFSETRDAVTISFEASQKAHNTLDWLLSKQAKTVGSRYFLVWNSGKTTGLISPEDNPYGISYQPDNGMSKMICLDELSKNSEKYTENQGRVTVLVLDAATSGRMAVVYYQNMELSRYLQNLQAWQKRCWWLQIDFDSEKKPHNYHGAPALWKIARGCLLGGDSQDELLKNIRTHLYPAIVEGKLIPEDISRSIFLRTCQRMSFTSRNDFEEQLRVACAVLYEKYSRHKIRERKAETMLDKTETDRSYLCGRLLGVADIIEERARKYNVPNGTNAERLMTTFSIKPRTSWMTIYEALEPYRRIQRKNHYSDGQGQIDEIMGLFAKLDDFDDRALDGRFLLGYSAQRIEMNNHKK
ncbi:MAG: type I-C CRISPR-associated protein Cas8c/Csd1 [Streptococcaceae bacterium]|jgi:CRISPR-associated protein Csd1|nr:type I-C CRISPR-associated protein Cas8c/Csd1 [Streptococcaceae bacterium]